MAASAAGIFVNALSVIRGTTRRGLNLGYTQSCTFLQTRNYAARKGTREKARKKKVQVEIKKTEFIPHIQRGVKQIILPVDKVRPDDSIKDEVPDDDVWIGKYHKWKIWPFADAVQCHKETHSMGMLDLPNAYVQAYIELDMTGPKPSKNVTKFSRLVAAPHSFDHGEKRTLIAFCKDPALQDEAKKAGATIAGGSDLITKIQTGEISLADYEYLIAHPNMMAELVAIKGLTKRKFPTAHAGTLGIDIPAMVEKCIFGMKYSGSPHDQQPLYGISQATFGRLDMDAKQLEENFAALISDLNTLDPKGPGSFITRIRLTTELGKEFLKVNHELYTGDSKAGDDDDDDDDEDDPVAIAV